MSFWETSLRPIEGLHGSPGDLGDLGDFGMQTDYDSWVYRQAWGYDHGNIFWFSHHDPAWEGGGPYTWPRNVQR